MAYDFNHDVLYWTTGKGLVVQLSPKSEDNELTDLQELLTGPASIGIDYVHWQETVLDRYHDSWTVRGSIPKIDTNYFSVVFLWV